MGRGRGESNLIVPGLSSRPMGLTASTTRTDPPLLTNRTKTPFLSHPTFDTMYDTFNASCSILIPTIAVERLRRQGADGWEPSYHGGADRPNGEQDYVVKLTHCLSGLKFFFRRHGELYKISGEMPRLIGHLSNGINLKGPVDLESVRGAVKQRLKEIAGIEYWSLPHLTLTRLDLTLNLNYSPGTMLALHRHARHPMIRKETKGYESDKTDYMTSLNSVIWPGIRTVISMYDKKEQIYKRGRRGSSFNSTATRVEVQLRSAKHIAKQMPWANRSVLDLADLSFDDGYRAFRNILLKFPKGMAAQSQRPSLTLLLALLDKYGPLDELGGMDAMGWYRAHCGIRSYQRRRKQVGEVQSGMLNESLEPFSWEDVLPAIRLPDVVDVNHDGEETLIPSP